ncbi:MAG: TlpA disulfide reductase family protein [Pseudomonadota bacterium]
MAAVAQEAVPELSDTLAPLAAPVDAPEFTLADMDGERHSLSGYRGSWVLVNFWATWCPPCRKEMPALERLYQDYGERGLKVLALNQWEDADHVFSYMGELNVFPSFPILFDPDSRVADAWGVRGLPTTFLVDPQGRIVYRAVGGRDFAHPGVRGLIESLLTP